MVKYFKKGDDTIKIEVLSDGSIKVETDQISAANHMNAEDFILEIVKKAGGEVNRERKGNVLHHEHDGHFHTH